MVVSADDGLESRVMTCVTQSPNGFLRCIAVLRTSPARRTGSVHRPLGVVAPELLEDKGSSSRDCESGKQMDRFIVSYSQSSTYHRNRHALWLLTVLICSSLMAPAQKIPQRGEKGTRFSTRVTHLLGFESARNNSTGTLSVQDDSLQFQQNGKPDAKVNIALVRDVFLGTESKQVGGLPMTLGKTAAPFGGGRVVSLFAHKKYDTLTLEYVDDDGGLHGAIFQINKGQGDILEKELAARGVHVSAGGDRSPTQSTMGAAGENK